ncbi:hypothetical protein TeGR_g14118 [Tetraparma gracilis]|uniref:Tim44-like domain-containing protein n=1 Tax=Tetraparma gracilis TaxID=2962635 RepID=A0ABQ6NAW4_9STRA|nr:hypothetical protein TeGR_g14118 [Tetraparma gracilis]
MFCTSPSPPSSNSSSTTADTLLARDLSQAINRVKTADSNPTIKDSTMQRELRSKALETPSAVARLAMEGDARLNITKDRLEDGEETLPSRPAASLTPADVVLSVLYGLSNPDDPYPNAGIDRLLNFSSPVAAANGLSAAEFRTYLGTTKYAVLLNHSERVFDRKVVLSQDKRRAFCDVKVRGGPDDEGTWSVASFVLSERDSPAGSCWLLDSMLVREKL